MKSHIINYTLNHVFIAIFNILLFIVIYPFVFTDKSINPIPNEIKVETVIDTVSNKKSEVNENEFLQLVSEINTDNILFENDKSDLVSSSYTELFEIMDILNAYPQKKLLIVGHTDLIGGAEYNLILSQKRANTVADFLIKLGISKERIFHEGKGESEPIRNESNKANRRVELKFF